jgi:6-phosphogluconolactonase (cycloisomerase 2 family)
MSDQGYAVPGVRSIRFSPDYAELAAASPSDGSIWIFSRAGGAALAGTGRRLPAGPEVHGAVDFGGRRLRWTISGSKYEDVGADGDAFPSDPGLGGFEIEIVGWQPVTTNAAGAFSFPNLLPGVYELRERQQEGWLQTEPSLGLGTGDLDLTRVELCLAAPPIQGVSDIVTSPDGRDVYLAFESGAKHVNALVVWSNENGCIQAFQDPLHHSFTGGRVLQDSRSEFLPGFHGPSDVTISPDGAHVYVAARSGSSLFVFSRDAATGLLAPIQVLQDAASTSPIQDAQLVHGLRGVRIVALDAGGTRLLAAGDRTLLNFARAADGRLSLSQVFQDASAVPLPGAIAVTGLGSPTFIEAGARIAVGGAGGLLVFSTTGPANIGLFRIIGGLDGARAASSLDHQHLYVVLPDSIEVVSLPGLAAFDSDPVLARLATSGARGVAISPDDGFVYVPRAGGSIDRYRRDPASGRLSYLASDALPGAIDADLIVFNGNTDPGFPGVPWIEVWAAGRVTDPYAPDAVFAGTRDGATHRPGHHRVFVRGANPPARRFGNHRLAEVRGVFYEDLDGDGQRDAGEPPASGFQVFADLDLDGVAEPGEPGASADLTGGFGFFVMPGSRAIRTAGAPGWTQTTPGAAAGHQVALQTGQVQSGLDFGVRRSASASTLSGRVVVSYEGGEGPAPPGTLVYVDLDGSGAPSAGEPQTTSNALGEYALVDVAPGQHGVAVIPPSGFGVLQPRRSTGSGALTSVEHVRVFEDPAWDAFFNIFAGYPIDLATSHDGRWLYAASQGAILHSARDAESGQLAPGEVVYAPALSSALRISSDDRFLYLGTRNGIEIYAIDPESGALGWSARNSLTELSAIELSRDGSSLYAGHAAGIEVFSRDPLSGGLTAVARVPVDRGPLAGISFIEQMALDPTGRRLAVSALHHSRGTVLVFERDSGGGLRWVDALQDGGQTPTLPGAQLIPMATYHPSSGLAWSPDGAHLYRSGGYTLGVLGRPASGGRLTHVGTLTDPQHINAVGSLLVPGDGSHLYALTGGSSCANASLIVSTFSRNSQTGELSFAGSTAPQCVSFFSPVGIASSPDGRHVYAMNNSEYGGEVEAFERDLGAPGAPMRTTFVAAGEHAQGIDFTLIADLDLDGIRDDTDLCPYYASSDQADTDADGRGDVCECSDQNGDGRNAVGDLVAINIAMFTPSLATPLCDGNNDGACNVSDIIAANVEIFSPTSTSTCSRQPVPGP